jgi:hypothetical protein
LAPAAEITRANGMEPPERNPDDVWIVPNSNQRIPYRPLERYDSLCNVFAKVKSASDLLKFVELFGPLTRIMPNWGDSVADCLKCAHRMHSLLLCKQKGPRKVESVFKSQLWESYNGGRHCPLPTLIWGS